MTHDKFRAVMMSTVGAVILMPVIALAQSDSTSQSRQGSQGATRGAQGSGSQGTQGSGSQGSGSQGTQGSGTQGSGSGASGSGQSNAMGGQHPGMPSGMQSGSTSSASTARQSIDPAEVQRVFGTDVSVVDLQSLGADQIRSVQQSLKDRGHYMGPIDGVYGPQTRAGLRAVLAQQYSLNQRLINQGQVAGPLASSMGIQQSDMAPVGGTDARSGQQSPSMNRTQPTMQQGGSNRGSSSSGSSNSGSSNSGSSGTGRSNSGSSSGSSNSGSGTSGSGTSGSGTSGSGTSGSGTSGSSGSGTSNGSGTTP